MAIIKQNTGSALNRDFTIEGNIIDLFQKSIRPGLMMVENGKISFIHYNNNQYKTFILPGFIDSHIHIESSMLVPYEFARLAVVHGTIATVSDPHEIANVCGMDGIKYMINDGNRSPLKFHFGAPSCVPATTFETSGATIDSEDIEELFMSEDINYLAEMMNWPGVLNDAPEVISKIMLAKKFDLPIDGHAPGLINDQAQKYILAGISTDHECFTKEEAVSKLNFGMKILIREGSAAKNFEALCDLIDEYPDRIMFCSDDKHPNDLIVDHINGIVKRSIAKGKNLFNVLRAACYTPVKHYNLKTGLLNEKDPADFIVVDNLTEFNVLQTYINGTMVAENGKCLLPELPVKKINNFNCSLKTSDDFRIKSITNKIKVITALDGQLVTSHKILTPKIMEDNVVSDIERDILKFSVINRYNNSSPAIAFIQNFGLKKGAIASSVGHDCHNILAVGVSDEEICRAVNLVIANRGGVSLVEKDVELILPLPVAGLMSDKNGEETAELYTQIDKKAKECGSTLKAPFMTLSFMALLVIPSLKLSDKGLFDGENFKFCDLFV